MKEKVLVIGGVGFIGSNTVEELVIDGYNVVVLDNEETGHPKNLEAVKEDIDYTKGDKGNKRLVRKLFSKVDYVMDFAGYCSAPMFKPDPQIGVQKTVCSFLNVLEEAKRAQIQRLVYASSCVVYGNGPVPSKENDPLPIPRFFYAESKIWMERAAKIYNDLYGLPSIGLRLFSNYGPHEQYKRNWKVDLRNVLTQCIEWISNGEQPWFYEKGKQTRDYVYVIDTAECFIKALDHGRIGEVYNVGTGIETSYNEGLRLINDLLGKDIDPIYVEEHLPDYILRSLSDQSKTWNELGWKAKVPLKRGLELQIENMRKEGVI